MACSDVKVTNRPAGNCSGGSDQGGKQTKRPEHNEMAATSKIPSAVKSLERSFTVRRPILFWGRPMLQGKQQVSATCRPSW